MRKIAILIFLFHSVVLFGQKVKVVVTTYPNSDDIMEIYSVLRSDKSVKHGGYLSFYKGSFTAKEWKRKHLQPKKSGLALKEMGYYEQNHRTSLWTTYDSASIYYAKIEEGQYSNDKKIGVWMKYVDDRNVIKRFDFDNNKELPCTVNLTWKYPSEARKNGIEGTVRIKIIYNQCEAIDYQILEDIGYQCGNAVIEALKEKQSLEKKYGIKSTKCDVKDEIVKIQFKLNALNEIETYSPGYFPCYFMRNLQ